MCGGREACEGPARGRRTPSRAPHLRPRRHLGDRANERYELLLVLLEDLEHNPLRHVGSGSVLVGCQKGEVETLRWGPANMPSSRLIVK